MSAQLCAQTIDVTGKVTDSNGNGVPGATVALKGKTVTTTTAADGTYRLSSSTAIGRPDAGGRRSISLNDRLLRFQVQRENTPVSIGLYSLKGRRLASLADGNLSPGNYSLLASASEVTPQACFLKVRIGNDRYTFKMPDAGQSRPGENALHLEPTPSQAVAKAAATYDSITVQKTGYSSDVKRVGSYTGVYNFVIVQPDVFWGSLSSYPVATQVMTYVFLNRTRGAYADNQVYWTFGNQTKTIAEQRTLDMPANSSGRVTFHYGTATGQYWDFMEHTISANTWDGNTTRVDAFGFPIAIRLVCNDGTDMALGEKYEVFTMGRTAFFQAYKDQVPAEFTHCAVNQAPYRIVAPGKGDGGFGPGQQYANYYNSYLQQLAITGATTNDVFACTGNPFGSNAQLAGAVNRHVAHLPQAQWGNRDNYYLQAPANYYAKFLHDYSFEGKAYGFAYDDSENNAAYTGCQRPKYLIIALGF